MPTPKKKTNLFFTFCYVDIMANYTEIIKN